MLITCTYDPKFHVALNVYIYYPWQLTDIIKSASLLTVISLDHPNTIDITDWIVEVCILNIEIIYYY